jgi:hypothetical protein
MTIWLRRLGYMAIILLWLVTMTFPLIAFILATRTEIELGDSSRSHIRIFMVQDPDLQGVGLETSRRVNANPLCLKTNVAFFLWQGASANQNASFCQCYDEESGASAIKEYCNGN